MDQIQLFREYTRQLECNLGNMNTADCCQCGVNESQCFAIVEIGRRPGISVKDLAGILKVDKSGISRSVEELVKKGLVVREPSKEDRRYVNLSLTKEGNEQFEKIEHDMYLEFKKVYEKIPVNKQDLVLEALRIYNDACELTKLNRTQWNC